MKASKVVLVCVAALAGLLAVLGVLAFWLSQPHGAREVAVSPDGASPEEVVAAYTDALDGHDCDAAEAMVVDGRWSDVAHWCDDLASLDDVRVGEPFGARRLVTKVPVSFDVKWRLFHGDGSLGGTISWGYRLARDSVGEPWRIAGHVRSG